MNTPNHPFDESLLSAYLDNEVTESERQVIDQALASSAELRSLLDELTAIRELVVKTQLHSLRPSDLLKEPSAENSGSEVRRRIVTSGPWNTSINKDASVGKTALEQLLPHQSLTDQSLDHEKDRAVQLIGREVTDLDRRLKTKKLLYGAMLASTAATVLFLFSVPLINNRLTETRSTHNFSLENTKTTSSTKQIDSQPDQVTGGAFTESNENIGLSVSSNPVGNATNSIEHEGPDRAARVQAPIAMDAPGQSSLDYVGTSPADVSSIAGIGSQGAEMKVESLAPQTMSMSQPVIVSDEVAGDFAVESMNSTSILSDASQSSAQRTASPAPNASAPAPAAVPVEPSSIASNQPRSKKASIADTADEIPQVAMRQQALQPMSIARQSESLKFEKLLAKMRDSQIDSSITEAVKAAEQNTLELTSALIPREKLGQSASSAFAGTVGSESAATSSTVSENAENTQAEKVHASARAVDTWVVKIPRAKYDAIINKLGLIATATQSTAKAAQPGSTVSSTDSQQASRDSQSSSEQSGLIIDLNSNGTDKPSIALLSDSSLSSEIQSAIGIVAAKSDETLVDRAAESEKEDLSPMPTSPVSEEAWIILKVRNVATKSESNE